MIRQTITTADGTYEIVYPTIDSTLASTKDVAETSINTAPSIGGSFSKSIYTLDLGIEGTADSAFSVEGQAEKYITVPTDGTWFAEVTIASLDPNQSMIVKEKIKFTVVDGVYTYVEGWEAQQHQTWIKSPDGQYPPVGPNVWLIMDQLFGSYGVRADVYGFYEDGCDFKGTIVFSEEIAQGVIPTSAPSAFATASADSTEFMADSDDVSTFEQVLTDGRYLHKIKIYGASGPGAQITFYAEPVFEIQYDSGTAQLVHNYNKNIITQGNANHDIVIMTQDNGFRIQVHAPATGSTYFTAILDIPELVSSTIINIPTVYEIDAAQGNFDDGVTYPLDLVINNGALSGGVLDADELPDGTYDMVANITSVQYPGDFEVNITKRFIVADSFADVTEDANYDDYVIVVDNTGGAAAALEYGTHPVTDEVGIYVTATGYATPSNFQGTLTVTTVV